MTNRSGFGDRAGGEDMISLVISNHISLSVRGITGAAVWNTGCSIGSVG